MHRTSIVAIAIAIASALVASACNHVPVIAEAEAVRAVSADEVSGCKNLGKTHVTVVAKILFINRSQEKVAKELETLARNEAARSGGNAVVPESEISAGRQTYGVYQCATIPYRAAVRIAAVGKA